MTSNEKNLNYKIVYLVESYKFHIKFTSIRVYKKVMIFYNRLTLTAIGHDGCRCYNTNAWSPATVLGYNGRRLVLLHFSNDRIFL
jgi:hypothetical protein